MGRPLSGILYREKALSPPVLKGLRRGMEKESLGQDLLTGPHFGG